MTIETTKTYMKISSVNKKFDTIAKTKTEQTLAFLVESLDRDVSFTSHFYITNLLDDFDAMLGLFFIKTLDPNVHNLQIGQYKLRPLIKQTYNNKKVKQVMTITENVFGLGKDDSFTSREEKIKLLSETVHSNELDTLLKQYQYIFTESFVSIPPKRNLSFVYQKLS